MNDWYLDAEGFSDFMLIPLDEEYPEDWPMIIRENELRMNALMRLEMTFAQVMGG